MDVPKQLGFGECSSSLRRRVILALALGLTLGLAGCKPSPAAPAAVSAERAEAISNHSVAQSARVVGVTDGDSLTVLVDGSRQVKVRLSEIDAPERGQPWGQRSKQTLAAMVAGQQVEVQAVGTDNYGRTLAVVFVSGRNVNRAMIEQGGAWAFRRYLTDQSLIDLEARARASRRGLWSMPQDQTVAPWDWRRGERSGAPAAGDAPPMAPQRFVGAASAGEAFSCGSKRYCREMSSCEEATYYLRRCGLTSIDGNGDGEPCEKLCGTMSQ